MSATDLPHRPRLLQVPLPNGPIALWVPAGTDALLDALAEAPPDPDDKMPYWADLWPSAMALAAAIDEGAVPVRDRTVLEVGAGLGLASLAAARAGGRVQATDWDEDALRYVVASAAENRVSVAVRTFDWRSPAPQLRAATVLAADVLYEPRNVPDLLRALPAVVEPRGEIWVADPGRPHLVDFVKAAGAFALAHQERTVESLTGEKWTIELLRLTRADDRVLNG